MAPLIEMTGITREYGVGDAAVHALDSIDLTIESGEFVAIMGPSGSGKSTLMNILGLLDRPTGGRYLFSGYNIRGLKPDQLADHRNRDVGFIFQGFNLLPRASAVDNVALPLVYRGVGRDQRRRLATAALDTVGLGHRRNHRPQQLSGGEQQRVAIARATVGNPPLLLADEPTGALDTNTGREILSLFRDLHKEGHTIVLITHDRSVAQYAHRTVLLRDGKIVADMVVSGVQQVATDREDMSA